MIKDFKAFVLRGNVVDLAIAVVIGAAFGKVIASFVANLLTPLISIPGKTNFSGLQFTVNHSVFKYGTFINDVIAFLIIAAAVFFFLVKPVNHLMARYRPAPDEEIPKRDCPECISSIPVMARRCAFCSAEVTPAA
ncbi:MAG: large conductance mechanosensitive channel protein MscL [Acidimicrobiales bacterium]